MSTGLLELDQCDFGVASGHAGELRLSAATRRLAARYLAGEMGRSLVHDAIRLPAEAATLPPDRRHACAVRCIAGQAPLRVLADELLLGTSTLREATRHSVPGLGVSSTSHTTVGFGDLVREGLGPLRHRLVERLADPGLDQPGRDFLLAAQECLEALAHWHQRNLVELARLRNAAQGEARQRLERVLAAASQVPEQPARSFHEALQALWTQWEFLRLCGDWSGLGRIDRLLGPYLEADLAAGAITLDGARELLAHFWIKGCGWIGANPVGAGGSGDAQFYQNVVLAGLAPDGTETENAVTHLVLEVVEELHISDFPVAVRVSPRTSGRLWRRLAQVQRRGGGIVSIYNEDLIIRALTGFGLPLADARDFANDGCWEVLVPGRTAFCYAPFDALLLLQEALGLEGGPVPEDFAGLYAGFTQRLRAKLDQMQAVADAAFSNGQSAPLLSLFVAGCLERARGYHSGGAHYQFCAPHAGGLPDVANSLLAIRHLVCTTRRLSLAQLVAVLRADWVGHEALRAEVQREVVLYGNGDAAADAMLGRVFDDYVAAVARVRERNRVHRPAGISTFGRELSYRAHRHATAFGAKRGAILSSNLAPTPGSERHGPTAVIRSFCGLDFSRLPNGTPLDLKLFPGDLAGEEGLAVLIALERTFLALGGWYLQLDVVDAAVLRDAQEHPERHANLAVRISGWSARFTTLDRDWQQLVIGRCEHRLR